MLLLKYGLFTNYGPSLTKRSCKYFLSKYFFGTPGKLSGFGLYNVSFRRMVWGEGGKSSLGKSYGKGSLKIKKIRLFSEKV